MIGYNPSHLNKNETLLEAFHRVEAYLKANPQYQVYQSSATYQEGTQEYALSTIVVPEGSKVSSGDVVLFSNVYYAVITAVSETTFSVETATNFRGVQGEQGPKGDTGATGAKGETGLAALMYSKNVILGPSASFSTDLDGYNRTPQINDICAYYSSNTDTIVSGTIEEIRPDTQQVLVRKIAILSTRGPRGETGPKGEDGEDGNATLLYAGELSESITTAEISQVTRPVNRGILVKDILISTAASTFGAMAQVTALPVGVTTVTVQYIGILQGGSSAGDYNVLANIPVINQDLTASGFTPVANTYYRHTGATTDTFTQGVIYLYDTAYHKLGESGGGTTLNRYTYIGRQRNIILSILQNAKSIVSMGVSVGLQTMSITATLSGGQGFQFILSAMWRDFNDGDIIYVGATSLQSGDISEMVPDDWKIKKINSDGTIQNVSWQATNYKIVYYNDTELSGT